MVTRAVCHTASRFLIAGVCATTEEFNLMKHLLLLCFMAVTYGVCHTAFRFLLAGVCGTTEEFNLVKHLLSPDTYDVNVRPVQDVSDNVTVYLGMALNQLIDLVGS